MWHRVGWYKFTDVLKECAAAIFFPQDAGFMFVSHVDTLLPYYTASYARGQ
jgi:hypothetical protein